MRRRYIAGIAICLVLLAGLAYWLFYLPHTSKVKIPAFQESDLVLIAPKTILGYQVSADGSFKQHQTAKVNLPLSHFEPARFGSTLVASIGDHSSFTKDERIMSLDLSEGRLNQYPTEHYGFSGTGSSEDYFYTMQSTTEDADLYKFDKAGQEVNHYHFDYSTLSDSHFTGQAGKLYMIGTKASPIGEGGYDNHLYIFNEADLTLDSTILLDDDPDRIWGFVNSVVDGDRLYMSLTASRDRVTHEVRPEQAIVSYDLKTQERKHFDLGVAYPNMLYQSKSKRYLITYHEPASLGREAVSVLDLETGRVDTIDVSGIINFDGAGLRQVYSVETDKHNNLYILTSQGLISWQMEQNRLINYMTDIPDEAFYLWVRE